MAKRAAIRNEGKGAEAKFLQLVANSRKSNDAKKGDVIVKIDGEDHFVEVKQIGHETSRTANQIRAIKFIPCAIWVTYESRWYVLAPDQQVRCAAEKARGQHTEIAFECMNLNLRSLSERYHTKTMDANLEKTVALAIQSGKAAPELQRLMSELFRKIVPLMDEYRAKVKSTT